MATPHPPNPRSLFTPKSAEIPLADRPLTLDFTLPDHTRARVVEVETFDSIHVFLPSGSGSAGDDDAEHIAEWHREDGKGDKEKTSLHGVVQEHRAVWEDVWTLSLGEAEAVAGAGAEAIEGLMRHIWVSVYACEWRSGERDGESSEND